MKMSTFLIVLFILNILTIGDVKSADFLKSNSSQEMITGGKKRDSLDTANNNQKIINTARNDENGWWSSQPKEKKMFYTNLTAVTAIGIWGLATWDYGSASLHIANEGWFEHGSRYGGADKAGHFWATYAFSDSLTGLYRSWGYASDKANAYGALSAWSVQTFMELADSTTGAQGFSWTDLAANTAGSLISALMEEYPALDRKIDFRIEFVQNVPVNGIFDDYSNFYYSMVLKLDGFDTIENTFLKYIELHGGYYTRGYQDDEESNIRSFYGGISLNFSRLFYQYGHNKTAKMLEYIQIPYTVPKVSYDLD